MTDLRRCRASTANQVAFHSQLEGAFDTMNEGAFKELRRMLPVTRAKFPWEQARNPSEQ